MLKIWPYLEILDNDLGSNCVFLSKRQSLMMLFIFLEIYLEVRLQCVLVVGTVAYFRYQKYDPLLSCNMTRLKVDI